MAGHNHDPVIRSVGITERGMGRAGRGKRLRSKKVRSHVPKNEKVCTIKSPCMAMLVKGQSRAELVVGRGGEAGRGGEGPEAKAAEEPSD